MSLKEAENIIGMVEKVLKSVTPRNEYEANNMYLTNMERLAQARRCLNDFTGAFPESILERINNLELKVKEKRTSFSAKVQHDAFTLNFDCCFGESSAEKAKTKIQKNHLPDGKLTSNDEINDEDDFTKQLINSASSKKGSSIKNASDKNNINNRKTKNSINKSSINGCQKKNNSNKSRKKSTKNAERVDQANTSDDNLKIVTGEQKVTSENVQKVKSELVYGSSNDEDRYVVQQTKDAQCRENNEQMQEEIVRQDTEVEFSAIPPAVLTKGGRCTELANSPLVCVRFTEPVVIQTTTHDVLCSCKIEVYKCIWLALAWGCPVLPRKEQQQQQQEQQQQEEIKVLIGAESAKIDDQKESGKSECSESNELNVVKEEKVISNWQSEITEDGDVKCSNVGAREDDTDVCESSSYSQHLLSQQNNVDILSEELIAKYDATVEANLVYERDCHFPQVISAEQARRLRELRLKGVWVILLCHGGCFAGGVYKNGKCIVHKAFQRYVIRKKQGGKQSNFGDSSTFHSAGSMIRSAQELKWKIDVRAILLSWRMHIDEADIILYAAPGPQNRTILTDFSQLPPLTSVPKNDANSPVQLSDKRVWGIPMTTHKPSFTELQRIYDALTHINLIYTKFEK